MRILPDRPQLLALLFVFGKDHLPTAVFLCDGLGEFLGFFHRLRVSLKLEKDGVLVREFQCQALRWGCCFERIIRPFLNSVSTHAVIPKCLHREGVTQLDAF